MAHVSFATLWAAHPSLQSVPNHLPCSTNGVAHYEHQCASRMAVCLAGAGISLASFRGACCWHGHGRRHPLRAEELMLWLDTADADFVGRATVSKRNRVGRQKAYTDYAGRSGIVVCRNFWGQNNQGDHIDLWDGETMAKGGSDYFQRSAEIWFWDLA